MIKNMTESTDHSRRRRGRARIRENLGKSKLFLHKISKWVLEIHFRLYRQTLNFTKFWNKVTKKIRAVFICSSKCFIT